MSTEEDIHAALEHVRRPGKMPHAAYYEIYYDSVHFFDQSGGLIMAMSKSNFEALSKEKK